MAFPALAQTPSILRLFKLCSCHKMVRAARDPDNVSPKPLPRPLNPGYASILPMSPSSAAPACLLLTVRYMRQPSSYCTPLRLPAESGRFRWRPGGSRSLNVHGRHMKHIEVSQSYTQPPSDQSNYPTPKVRFKKWLAFPVPCTYVFPSQTSFTLRASNTRNDWFAKSSHLHRDRSSTKLRLPFTA